MMEFDRLGTLPPGARTWLYASDRELTDAETENLQSALDLFFAEWSSHGRVVSGCAQVCENRVVAIGAHVSDGDISGCGIDKSVHLLDRIGQAMGITWVSGLTVA